MSHYIQTKIAIPADSAEICNRIGHVIDPDTGGSNTFEPNASVDGNLPFTHCLIDVLLTPSTRDLLLTRNGNTWLTALETFATERGRVAPSISDCQHMVSVITIDEEVSVVYANLDIVG